MESNNLFNSSERYIVFPASLATTYGETAAIVLNQLHYLTVNRCFGAEQLVVQNREGRTWLRLNRSVLTDPLDGALNFLTPATINRVIGKLREKELLEIDRKGTDTWYSINHAKLEEGVAAKKAELEAERQRKDSNQ